MDNRILSISLSTIAHSLRAIADSLGMLANQLNPTPPKAQVWDPFAHKFVPTVDYIPMPSIPKPVAVVTPRGHDPIEKGPIRD